MNVELRPSAAPQWGRCSGSVSATLIEPPPVSDRVRGGRASHWLAAQILGYWAGPKTDSVPMVNQYIGTADPDGTVIDDEIAEGAEVYTRSVLDVAGRGALSTLRVEYPVTVPAIHGQCSGTLDAAAYVEQDRTLHVWDYKFGHREVEAVGNLQGVCYMAGLLPILPRPISRLVFHVVQPFCYYATESERTWCLPPAELAPYVELLQRQAAEATTNPTLTAGPHCRDCSAIARCPAARRAGYSVITYAQQPYALENMAGADLAVEREILQVGIRVVQARLDAVEDELRQRIGDGDTSSGLTLQGKYGRVTWTVSPAVAIAFAAQFGVDAAKLDALTPTQVLAAVPAKLRPMAEKALQAVTRRPGTGVKLVPVDDSYAARAFHKRSN